jgi:hypothetical protein
MPGACQTPMSEPPMEGMLRSRIGAPPHPHYEPPRGRGMVGVSTCLQGCLPDGD